jgi:plasmid maintenance system antidote protein VapI
MTKRSTKPVHPGIYLKEVLDELKLSQYRLAKDLGIPAMRIMDVPGKSLPEKAHRIIQGKFYTCL